jgi:hypothetical protein
LIVTVDVTAPVPVMVPGWLAVQVGKSTAPAGLEVTAQVSATVPVKPPLGVTVMVDVPFAPGDAMLTGSPLRVNAGDEPRASTVSATAAVSVSVPEVPVTVAV